jgi:hypothetical protein
VVLAADDQQVGVRPEALGADIVIGVGRVPEEDRGQRPGRDRQADDECAIGGLLGVEDHAVVERDVGGDHDVVGLD